MASPRTRDILTMRDHEQMRSIKEPLNCPLCRKILREATTINLCMHSFCKRCINKKLEDEDPKACPVCNIQLGPKVRNYLRPDMSKRNIIYGIHFRRTKRDNVGEISSQGSTSDMPVVDPSMEEANGVKSLDNGPKGDQEETSSS